MRYIDSLLPPPETVHEMLAFAEREAAVYFREVEPPYGQPAQRRSRQPRRGRDGAVIVTGFNDHRQSGGTR